MYVLKRRAKLQSNCLPIKNNLSTFYAQEMIFCTKFFSIGTFTFYWVSFIFRLVGYTGKIFYKNGFVIPAIDYSVSSKSNGWYFLWLDWALLWKYGANAGHLGLPCKQ